MSTDFSIKPVGAPVATPVAQPASDAANSAVADRTAREPKRHRCGRGRRRAQRSRHRRASDSVSHQAFLDRAAGSIVYQVIDNRTNQVVQQFPDEAMLRRRAYFHTLDLTKDAPDAVCSPPIARPEVKARARLADRWLSGRAVRPCPPGPRRYCN